MASQGLNNMLQEAFKDTTQDDTYNVLDNIEPLNELTNQFSDLQNAISQFTNIQKVFEDLQHGTGNNHQEKDNPQTLTRALTAAVHSLYIYRSD